MSTWQGNIALVLASTALGLTIYNHFSADKQRASSSLPFTIDDSIIPKQDRENLVALHGYILDLETRINELENSTPTIEPSFIESKVKQVIEEREKARIAEATKRNPSVNWFRQLPEDYRQRIKADPNYADKSINDAFTALLNMSNTDDDRLAAYGQLKMTLGMLRRDLDDTQESSAIDAMISISEYTNEPKIRIQALENLSHLDAVSPKLADYFQKLLLNDANEYVKNLSASALVAQFFRAKQLGKTQLATTLAQRIQMLESNGDSKVANAMTNNLKHPHLRDELNKFIEQ